jgi:hypothetical protein
MFQLPSVSDAVQNSETMRNSLGLNYETAALLAEVRRHERQRWHSRGLDTSASTGAERTSRQFRGARYAPADFEAPVRSARLARATVRH